MHTCLSPVVTISQLVFVFFSPGHHAETEVGLINKTVKNGVSKFPSQPFFNLDGVFTTICRVNPL